MLAVNRGLNKLGDSLDRIIEGVAVNRRAYSVPDELLDLNPRHAWRGRCARAVNDPLFDDRSVQIISTEPQCNLREGGSQRDPIRFYMRKVIEHQTRDGNRLQIVHSSCRRQM